MQRFMTWLSQTHPIARAAGGLVAPHSTILVVIMAFLVVSADTADDGLTAVAERTSFIQLPANARTEGAPAWVQIDPAGIEKLLHDIGDAGIAPAATQELTVLADVSVADPYGVMEQLKAAGEPEKVGEDEPFG